MMSTAEPMRDKIVELAEKGLKARAIFDRLRLEDPAFSASYWAVRGVWRRWHKERGVRAEDVAIPVETGPGEIAQVDFGYVGKLRDAASGVLRKAWVFVMVLAFSRRLVTRVVFELARHYGIKIDPAPIYAPKKKGKVESSVKYVKANFFAGRDGDDADDTRRELQRWTDEIRRVEPASGAKVDDRGFRMRRETCGPRGEEVPGSLLAAGVKVAGERRCSALCRSTLASSLRRLPACSRWPSPS
jgi:hypothetical protein